MATNAPRMRFGSGRAHIAAADTERGVALLITGNGKGKSTSAFGMVMRALGYGMKVGVVQFIKGDQLSRDPAIGDAYFSDPLVFLKGTVRFGSALIDAMAAARASISAIDRPTLVVHGTDDTIVPPSASAPLAASQHVERKMFPGIRHELHNEPESDEVLAYISRWIEGRLDELAAS